METTETKFQRVFRITTGVLMTLQTIIFFFIACFLFIFILLMGGLASVAGGGNATVEQFKNTWYMIGFMAVYPGFVAILMIIASVQIFRRTRSVFVIVTCLLFILPYLGTVFLVSDNEEMKHTTLAAVLPILIPIAAIIVAFQTRQQTKKLEH